MQTIVKKSLVCAVLLAVLPLAGHAHRSWLIPSVGQVEGKEPWVTFDAAVSENLFEIDTNAVKLEGLSVVGPDGQPVKVENPFTGRLRSTFDLKLDKPGTYRVALVSESIMASYKEGTETKRWRGSVEAFAKEVPANAVDLTSSRSLSRLETFVTSGKGNDMAFKPVGVGLELIPVTHPSDLTVGEPARFRLLMDGKPAVKQTVSVIPGGVRYRGVLREQTAVTDDKGEFTVTWSEAGLNWVTASYPPRPAGQPGGAPMTQPARRLTYGGTFEVLPK